MRVSCGLFAAILLAFPLAAAAQLTQERSPGLRVVYLDVTEGYLVPHVTRTALNSLAFQKKLFGFDPADDLTVLLLDLSDSGNAGASSVPGDLVTVQIAPLGFSFETLAANAQRVFAAANPLAHRLLSELQALLEVRAAGLADEWRFTATASGIAVAVGLGVVWLLALARPRPTVTGAGRGDDELPVGTLSYAREILESEELVHVGRAIRARGRGDAL